METDTAKNDLTPVFSLLSLLQRIVWTPHLKKDYGFTRTQFTIFQALAIYGVLNMTQIANFMGTSKEQATRAVSHLVVAGLAERIVPQDNRSYVEIHLTESGKTFFSYYLQKTEQRIHECFDKTLTSDEQQCLQDALTTATKLLKKVF